MASGRNFAWRLVCVTGLVAVAACDGDIVGTIVGLSPVPIPFLSADGGVTTLVAASGVPFDAAGFYEEMPDAGFAAVDERCSDDVPCDPAPGLACETDRLGMGRCQPRCGAADACPQGRTCVDAPGGGRFCAVESGAGGPCDVDACAADAGLACLPARVEGGRVLAFTCQVPCSPGGPVCPSGTACLPTPGTRSCDGGPCEGGAYACGTLAPQGSPGRLDDPGTWTAAETCNPGSETPSYCGQALDGGAPLLCVQGNSAPRPWRGGQALVGVEGLCVGVCRDPSSGASFTCPQGDACDTRNVRLVHVADPDAACVTAGDCNAAAGQVCAGPLPAYALGYRCAVPYGLCAPPPPPPALDGGVDAGRG